MNGSVKSTGMMIIQIFCTIVTLLLVVMTSETRKKTKKKQRQQEKETYKNVNYGGRDLLNLYFLQKAGPSGRAV